MPLSTKNEEPGVPYQFSMSKQALPEIVVADDMDEMITYFQVNGIMY